MKRLFIVVSMLLMSLFAWGGLASAQFLEENNITMRGITFNLPNNLLLSIRNNEVLIALNAASLDAYSQRKDVTEGFVVSIAFPEDLSAIGLPPNTPPKEVIERFRSLLESENAIEAYDTSYASFLSREAFAIVWGDSRVVAFDVDGVTAAVRIAGEYDTYKTNVNVILTSMKQAAPQSQASASSAPVGEELRQWAARATATSEYGSNNWSASQATGAPNVKSCSDDRNAWASARPNGKDTLTLIYETPVFAHEIRIYQTYNPGAITSVTVSNSQTGFSQKLPNSADPVGNTPCPGVFVMTVGDLSEPVDTVSIDLDQTLTGNWNEIDAVELIGVKP